MNKYKNNVGAGASACPSSKARQNRGITLIALVITIIVMLILVAVTISMAINGGLFQKAGEAVGETQNAIEDEQTLGSGQITIDGKVYSSIDDYLAGNVTYEINYIEDLVAVAYSVNKGEDIYLGNTIKLMRDLDFEDDASYKNPEAKYVLESANTGYKPDEETGSSIKELLLGDIGFIPVGTSANNGYYGRVEGNNKVIKNMKENSTAWSGGLLGYSRGNMETVVINLRVEDVNIAAGPISGGIIGNCLGTARIENCYVSGCVSSSITFAGGIVGSLGDNASVVSNCVNAALVSSSSSNGPNSIGGIAGTCNGTISDCLNVGSVEGLGGIVGSIPNSGGSGALVSGCCNLGEVNYYGLACGIAGQVHGEAEIRNCYNLGKIVSSYAPACGIAYGGNRFDFG